MRPAKDFHIPLHDHSHPTKGGPILGGFGDDGSVTSDSGIPGSPVSAVPTGAAGGDLSGTYPNPSVVDDSHNHTSSTAPGGSGHILLADGHSTPFAFNDLLQMDDGSDFMWSDS